MWFMMLMLCLFLSSGVVDGLMIDIPRRGSLCLEEEIVQTFSMGKSRSIISLRLIEKVSELSVGRKADGKFKKVYATILDSKERKIFSSLLTTTTQNVNIDKVRNNNGDKREEEKEETLYGDGDGYDTYRICFSNRGSADKERVELKLFYEKEDAAIVPRNEKESTLSQNLVSETNKQFSTEEKNLNVNDKFYTTLMKSKDKDPIVNIGLKPVQDQFYEIENWMFHTTQEFNSVRSREQYLQEMSSVMDTRVKWFSIFSIMVLLLVSIWQILYLRSYFQAKKLL